MIPAAGTLSATVDWTSPSNSLAAAIVVQTCGTVDSAFNGNCEQLAPPIFQGQKPIVIAATVKEAGKWRIWIANGSTNPESGTIRIMLTR
jgi:hypothetical protein